MSTAFPHRVKYIDRSNKSERIFATRVADRTLIDVTPEPIHLWLDDMRHPPDDSWYWAKTVAEAQKVLQTNIVTMASLDHDLGYREPTGYDLVKWMCANEIWPSEIAVHSWNPTGAENMAKMIDRYGPYPRPVRVEPCPWCVSPNPEVEEKFWNGLNE